jgi:hypothetical protein
MATALLLALVGCDPGSDPVGPDGTPDDRIEVRGALIHVDGQRGNNQNPGTPTAPFATIGLGVGQYRGRTHRLRGRRHVPGGSHAPSLTHTSNTFVIGPAGSGGASDGRAGADGIAAEVHGTG